MPAFVATSWFFLKDKSVKAKDRYMLIIMAVISLAYLIAFTIDVTTSPQHRARILANLPLHLCGINSFLYPLCFALRKKGERVKRVAFSYMYFVGAAGGLLGALMPPSGVTEVTVFTYNVIAYFIRHNFIFILPVMLVVLGYYKPRVKDVPISSVVLIGLMGIMHIVNLAFSAIGGYVVNYFYTREPDNFILEIFWEYIPYEFFYMFGLLAIAVPVFTVFYLSARAPDLIKKRETS